jgi:hypothetical protein
MFSFDRLKYEKIPIWENKRRIEYLTLFRDLVYDRNPAIGTQLRAPLSPSTGQPLDSEQRRIEINERRSMAQRMIALAGIKTRRLCARRRGEPEPPPLEVDVIDQLWDLETLGVSFRQPAETIEEAIGVYKHDQDKAQRRTRNPFFWAARILEWIAELPFGLISLFGFNQQKAVDSKTGQAVRGIFQLGILGALLLAFGWLVQLLSNSFDLLNNLGWKDTVLHWLKLK